MNMASSRLLVCLALCGAFVFAGLGTAPAAFTTAAEASSIVAQPGSDCDFTLGFAAVRDLLGPAVVGDCVENERFIAGNGKATYRSRLSRLTKTSSYTFTDIYTGAEPGVDVAPMETPVLTGRARTP